VNVTLATAPAPVLAIVTPIVPLSLQPKRLRRNDVAPLLTRSLLVVVAEARWRRGAGVLSGQQRRAVEVDGAGVGVDLLDERIGLRLQRRVVACRIETVARFDREVLQLAECILMPLVALALR